MKKLFLLFFVLALLPSTLFGYTDQAMAAVKPGIITGVANLKNIDEYGGVTINVSVQDFQNAGFKYADMVNVDIAGQKIKMPVVSNYRCATSGEPMLIMPGNKKRWISFQAAYSDFANQFNIAKKSEKGQTIVWHAAEGVKFPLAVTVTMAEKQGYAKQYEVYNLIRTYKRDDYKDLTDAEFCNFREVKTAKMGSGKLYRSSTPINTRLQRNYYADRLAKAAKVKTFLNLCDTEDAAKALPTFAKSYYATQKAVYLALNVDITSETFNRGMREMINAMLNRNAYPCLIHCVEGQDRTGFACALIELFMGASMEEVKADYVKTFMNYYGVKKGTEQYNVIANNIYLNLERAFKARLSHFKGFEKANTQELAKSYIKSLGFKEADLNQLWDNLAK